MESVGTLISQNVNYVNRVWFDIDGLYVVLWLYLRWLEVYRVEMRTDRMSVMVMLSLIIIVSDGVLTLAKGQRSDSYMGP